jgi:hypothetical protein
MQTFRALNGTDDDLKHATQFIRRYIDAVMDVGSSQKAPLNQGQCLLEAGWSELSDTAKMALSGASLLVLMAAYCHGYREMVSGQPASNQALDEVLRDIQQTERPTRLAKIKTALKVLWYAVQNR